MCLVMMLALLQALIPGLPDARGVTIIDSGPPGPYNPTEFDAGPAVGDMLNVHYFPAVIAYNTGRYRIASLDLTFVTKRAHYLDGNPRQAEFISVGHYLLGMIYFYHSKGIGRHELAKSNFETAIKWKQDNYKAYLELSRVYSDLGLGAAATSVIQRLIDLKPSKDIADEAQAELAKLKDKSSSN
jgi:hypothetical protein